MKILSPEAQGSLFAITSGLMYGLVGYFGLSLMNTNMSVSNMLFWRFLISALFIFFILVRDIKTFKDNAFEKLKAFLAGCSFYSTSTIAYFSASQYIGTGLSMVVFFTFPAFVMLLNWLFYRTKISKIYYFALILISIGMILLADLSDMRLDIIGIGLGILCAILYACYIVSSKKVKVSAMESTLMISLGCCAACLMCSLFDHSFFVPTTLYQWLHILGFGIFSTALPILFLLKGLKTFSAEKASILSVLEPVFVVTFGILLLGELITTLQILGILTILAGALITLFSTRMKDKMQPEEHLN